MSECSRRDFIAMAAAGAALTPIRPIEASPRTAAAVTAQAVIDRIKKNVGVEWKAETVDTFKAGDPSTAVTGIAATAMATLAVLNQVVKAGANLVITCEPTFYSRADTATPPPRGGTGPGPPQDSSSPPSADPVFAAKDEFIKRHGLVVWRFSDHWRLRKPDPLAQGLADAFGWSNYRSADDDARLSIPPMALDAVASHVKQALNGRGGIRVIGDPKAVVRTIGLLPGNTPIQAALKLLPSVDSIVGGEVREWESAEYVRDKVTAGEKKSLILVGRVLSQEPGMKLCAQWLERILPELRATWIPVGDLYWRPL